VELDCYIIYKMEADNGAIGIFGLKDGALKLIAVSMGGAPTVA